MLDGLLFIHSFIRPYSRGDPKNATEKKKGEAENGSSVLYWYITFDHRDYIGAQQTGEINVGLVQGRILRGGACHYSGESFSKVPVPNQD